jgi:hypothetical protein
LRQEFAIGPSQIYMIARVVPDKGISIPMEVELRRCLVSEKLVSTGPGEQIQALVRVQCPSGAVMQKCWQSIHVRTHLRRRLVGDLGTNEIPLLRALINKANPFFVRAGGTPPLVSDTDNSEPGRHTGSQRSTSCKVVKILHHYTILVMCGKREHISRIVN